MESPAPLAELVRWQTATLVAAAIAALELVLLVVLGIALLGGPAVKKVRAAGAAADAQPAKAAAVPTPAPKRTRLVARRPRSQTEIVVLNGNGITGAAGAAADRVRGLGYQVGSVGNAERSDYARTIVMYRRGYEAAATRLARDLRGGLVAPLDGMRPAELRGAHLVLLLGRP